MNIKPKKDQNYELRIGDSFYSSGKSYQTVQYQFKPTATIDRSKRGRMIKTHTHGKMKVFLEFSNNTKATPYSVGEGFYTECKDIECVLIFDGEKFQLERLSGMATGISLGKQAQPAATDNLTSSLSDTEFQGMITRPKDKNFTLINNMQHNAMNNHHNQYKKPPPRANHAIPVHNVNNAFHKSNNHNNNHNNNNTSTVTPTPSKNDTKSDKMSDGDDTGSEEDSEGSEDDDDSEGDTGDFTSRLMATIGDGPGLNTNPVVETVVASNPFAASAPPQNTQAFVQPAGGADQPMKEKEETSESESSESGESSSEDSETGESGSSEDSESSSDDSSSESSSDSEVK